MLVCAIYLLRCYSNIRVYITANSMCVRMCANQNAMKFVLFEWEIHLLMLWASSNWADQYWRYSYSIWTHSAYRCEMWSTNNNVYKTNTPLSQSLTKSMRQQRAPIFRNRIRTTFFSRYRDSNIFELNIIPAMKWHWQFWEIDKIHSTPNAIRLPNG